MKDLAIQSSALQARSTSGLVWSISLFNWALSFMGVLLHMSGSSKRDVMHLTVSNSESDLEESDTAV